MNKQISSGISKGDHGSTYSGGPLVCSAALATVREISKPEFLLSVRKKANLLTNLLNSLAIELREINRKNSSVQNYSLRCEIIDIRAVGFQFDKNETKENNSKTNQGNSLLIGVELNVPVKSILRQLIDSGILMISAGEKILRLVPPLIIEENQIRETIQALRKILIENSKEELSN